MFVYMCVYVCVVYAYQTYLVSFHFPYFYYHVLQAHKQNHIHYIKESSLMGKDQYG